MKIYQKTSSGMQLLSESYSKQEVSTMLDEIRYKEEVTPESATKIVLYSTLNSLNYKNGDKVENAIFNLSITKGTHAITKIALYVNGVLVKDDFTIDTNTETTKFNVRYTFEEPITSTTEVVFKVYDTVELNTAKIKITFVTPSYFGAVDAVDIQHISITEELTEVLLNGKEFEWNDITETNKIFCYAYPTALKELSAILDMNNFNMTEFFNKDMIAIGEVQYYLYYSSSTASLTNGRLKFV